MLQTPTTPQPELVDLKGALGTAIKDKTSLTTIREISIEIKKKERGSFSIRVAHSKNSKEPYLYEVYFPELSKEEAIKVFHGSGIFGTKNNKIDRCRKQIKSLTKNADKHHIYYEKKSSHRTQLQLLTSEYDQRLQKNLETDPSAGLLGLNDHFHDSYDRLITRALKTLGTCKRPVVLFFDDSVTVYYPGSVDQSTQIIETVFPFVTRRYEIIKDFSHGAIVPINDLVEPRTDVGKAERWQQRRNRLIELLESKEVIDELPSDVTALEEIRLKLLEFYQNNENPPELSEATRLMESLCEQFSSALKFAHEENILMVHAAIQRVRHIVGNDWDHTYCVVAGNRHAQSDEMTITTIKKVLGEELSTDPSKERNVMYAILPTTKAKMLLLLAEHISNSKIALGIFDDPAYLNAEALRQGQKTT